MREILLAFTVLLFAGFANANPNIKQVDLMISINHKGVQPNQIKAAVATLVRADMNTSNCYAEPELVEYIPFEQVDDIGYYGVAIIRLSYSCTQNAKAYIMAVQKDPRYTLWANPMVGPHPAASGGNG